MHRIDTAGNVANKFDPGDPLVPRQATVVDAPWLNDVQEELCNAITAAGITLVKGTQTQLRDAILALAAQRTIHYVGAASEPAFQNSWGNVASTGSVKVSFYKDSVGLVHVEGNAVVASAVANSVIFTLPVGYRHSNTGGRSFACACPNLTNGVGLIKVNSNGDVVWNANTGAQSVFFQIIFDPNIAST